MLPSVGFPFPLPIGDLSGIFWSFKKEKGVEGDHAM